LEALFPNRCYACGAFFSPAGFDGDDGGGAPADPGPKPAPEAARFRPTLSRHLCPACAAEIKPVRSPLCTRCGLMFRSREGPDHTCGHCLASPPRFDMARSFGVYDGVLLTLIHRFKYSGKTGLADPLGRLLFDEFRRRWPPGDIDLISPVPLHTRRFRRRGYNQAYLLIRRWPHLAADAGMAPGAVVIVREALARRRRTDHQVGMTREERDTNIRGAFSVDDPDRVAGRRVLLVDDVLTTGSTADECARTLLASGAARVDLLTLAQAPLLRPRKR
jgi:ComF family protein